MNIGEPGSARAWKCLRGRASLEARELKRGDRKLRSHLSGQIGTTVASVITDKLITDILL